MPSSGGSATGLLRRLASFLGGRGPAPTAEEEAAHARWPHVRRGWVDPDVPLHGWRTTVDAGDVEDVLRAVAAASSERLGEGEVREVLDFLAQLRPEEPRAFCFAGERQSSFAQVWIGLVRTAAASVRVFLLGDEEVVDGAQQALTVGGFAGAKRGEYDELSRFFLTAWEWRRASRAATAGASAQSAADPSRLGERMERVLSDRSAPFLELLRGLRGRVREFVQGTRDLDPSEVAAADAFLAARGAPTLTEMRRRLGETG